MWLHAGTSCVNADLATTVSVDWQPVEVVRLVVKDVHGESGTRNTKHLKRVIQYLEYQLYYTECFVYYILKYSFESGLYIYRPTDLFD